MSLLENLSGSPEPGNGQGPNLVVELHPSNHSDNSGLLRYILGRSLAGRKPTTPSTPPQLVPGRLFDALQPILFTADNLDGSRSRIRKLRKVPVPCSPALYPFIVPKKKANLKRRLYRTRRTLSLNVAPIRC